MATVEQDTPPLKKGDKLNRDEFLRRWEAMPRVKFAELIGGVVYMPSPLSLEHGLMENRVAGFLFVYKVATPGCETANGVTWLMAADSPQPDTYLRILPEYGGQSRNEGRYASGAPELLVEVCLSSTAYDLHEKLELYQSAGVQEYLAVLVNDQEVRRHLLVDGRFQVEPPDSDGVLRSRVFPGLWLHTAAILGGDDALALATLQQGLASPEHTQFVEQLRQRRA